MSTRNKVIIGIVIAVPVIIALIVGIGAASVWIRGGSGEPSEEISAPTLERRAAETEEATEEVAEDPTDEPTEEPTDEPTEEPTVAPTAVPPTDVPASNDLLFRIVPEQSEVRFILEEDLRGVRTTVLGTTDQVAGDILVDRVNPANSVIGTIRINVRTLQTDQEFRNRAIRAEILESARDEYEFSEFVPTELIGMPESVEVGQPFSFQIVGELTVRDITNEVTFEATVNPISETVIEGTASAQVLRSDYSLEIPDVPSVANVTNEVQLDIDFHAELVEE